MRFSVLLEFYIYWWLFFLLDGTGAGEHLQGQHEVRGVREDGRAGAHRGEL